jgi:hypothetical protein
VKLRENPDAFTIRLEALEQEGRPKPVKRLGISREQRLRDEAWD